MKKRENGMTLIAVAVNVLSLLILGGNSVNLLIGQNGIMSKAMTHKEREKIADYQQKLESVLSSYPNKENPKQEDIEEAISTVIPEEIDISIQGENIYIVHIGKYQYRIILKNNGIKAEYEGIYSLQASRKKKTYMNYHIGLYDKRVEQILVFF